MDAKSITSDFLAASAKTSAVVMNATGWKEGVINPEMVAKDSVFFYVLDQASQWIWSCSVPKETFHTLRLKIDEMEKKGNANFAGMSACTAFCSQKIEACVNDKNLSMEKQNDLGIALSAYVGKTKVYQLTENATKQNHFCVIKYGATNMLRPFAMGGPSRHLIDANQVQEVMAEVVSLDAKNHPEWFSKSGTMKSPITPRKG